MNKTAAAEVYIWNLRLSADAKPIPWKPPLASQVFQGDDCSEYFEKVFESVQAHLKVDGLIFYFTRDIHRLPSYGDNVVAIVIGDEWSRIPRYFHKVRAVFKCYGTRSFLGCNLFQPSYLNCLTLLQFIKAKLANFPGWMTYISYRVRTGKKPLLYDIPLGYSNQIELPIEPINNRDKDVFFAGSIIHRPHSIWSLKYWLETPKSLSRKQMFESVKRIQETHPNIQFELSITPGFSASYESNKGSDARTYSEKMMSTKICLAPRGTSFETFRFFEALRYGCIIITEHLPAWWFYQGAPAIQIDRWSDLGNILETVLSDPDALEKRHQETLNWWKEKCSESAIGQYIAEKLNETSCSVHP